MNGTKVELMQMLEARDYRYELQQKLLAEYQKPIISFTMNIAGPIKNNERIRWAFDYGNDMLEGVLAVHKIQILHKECIHEVTGNEAFYVVSQPGVFENTSGAMEVCTGEGNLKLARKVKTLAMQLEDELLVGRLFDIDILDSEGNHLDRVELGGNPRSCLICEKPAKECGRSRAHSVEELQKKTEEILMEAQNHLLAETIADLAVKSLLFEVGTTPKPGLVDLHDHGSHTDMDVFTFMSSAVTLRSYFETCVKEGILAKTKGLKPQELFEKLRFEGILAETKMKHATGGVNTHKGAIFSLGILCGAIGRVEVALGDSPPVPKVRQGACPQVSSEIKAMTAGLSEADAESYGNLTTGQKLYMNYGIRGARGEAEDGFPTVFQVALPMFEKCLANGMTLNDAGCQTLLAILSETLDTNMIARSNIETALAMREKIRAARDTDGFWKKEFMEALNQEFIEKNLSPGGSADLLSMTYFLYFLSIETLLL